MPQVVPPPQPDLIDIKLHHLPTSLLIVKLVEHQGSHPGSLCGYCRPWADELDRRVPNASGSAGPSWG